MKSKVGVWSGLPHYENRRSVLSIELFIVSVVY